MKALVVQSDVVGQDVTVAARRGHLNDALSSRINRVQSSVEFRQTANCFQISRLHRVTTARQSRIRIAFVSLWHHIHKIMLHLHLLKFSLRSSYCHAGFVSRSWLLLLNTSRGNNDIIIITFIMKVIIITVARCNFIPSWLEISKV